ncbi:MAG: hypothetical protein K0S65_126 [Labilithrix sp.]|nr:hypothetical protein [Labilithrix sp.]
MTTEVFPGAAFWREAAAIRGGTTARVLPRTLVFALVACLLTALHRVAPRIAIPASVMEASGLVLGLLLVFRTAGGYERWWEARKLWGAIVNQSRNLVVAAHAYGPADRAWQEELVRWVVAFAHVTRRALQDHDRELPEIVSLLGDAEAARIAAAEHMPSYVVGRVASLLRQARDAHALDPFAFLRIDRERAALLDHTGGCERILKTPIPRVYSVTIRRFVAIYLCALPLALAGPVGFLAPLYVMFIAYPILTLEQIGAELQNPFVIRSLSHLDLEQLCSSLERNIRAAGDFKPASAGSACPSTPQG